MNKSLVLSAAILAATASFSFADDQAGQSGQAGGPAAQRTDAQSGQAGQQNQQNQQFSQQDEQHFIRHASSDNQFEIQAAQFVQQNAQSSQVKELAQRLVQDHQKAQQQLQQVAQAMNVQISDQLDPVCQAKLQEMQKKTGPALERGFVFDQVGDHTKDLLMNRFVADNAQNTQLKQYAQQQVPILEQHLQLAQTAAEQYVPEARTAGERIRGAGQNIERRTRDLTGSRSSNDNSGSSSGSGSSGNSGK